MLKSSYNLEFLGIRRAVRERELEDRLLERFKDFLLELGYGFCFIGRQYRLTQVQFAVNDMRIRFLSKLESAEDRKAFVYLLARLVKSFHFMTCFFSYPNEVREFAAFAEYVDPKLVKRGSVSELMKQIRRTEVVKAAVAPALTAQTKS